MNRLHSRVYVAVALAAGFVTSAAVAALPEPLATGLKNPESIAISNDGRVFVTSIGDFDKDGDGAVLILDGKEVKPFAANLNDPKGIVAFGDSLFLTDKTPVVKVGLKDGKATTLVAEDAFPAKPQFLNDIAADEKGVLFVSDSGDRKGSGGAIFRVDQKGKTKLVADYKTAPKAVKSPNGLLLDSHFAPVGARPRRRIAPAEHRERRKRKSRRRVRTRRRADVGQVRAAVYQRRGGRQGLRSRTGGRQAGASGRRSR